MYVEVRAPPKLPALPRRTVVALAVALACAYAYFFPVPGYNQDSRLDLTRAIVEHGTLSIDSYQDNTGDKARFGDHYYSDKAPGQALLAVPAVAAVSVAVRQAGPSAPMSLIDAQRYAATLFSSALPTVIAAVAITFIARRCGSTTGGALFASAVYGLGTPAWVYATMMIGNNLAAAALVLGFAAAVGWGGSARTRRLVGLSVGLATGSAVLTEYPAAPAAAIVAVLAVARAQDRRVSATLPLVGWMALGAAMPGLIQAAYNQAAFGSVPAVSYSGVQGWQELHQGIMGVTYPRLDVLWELTFGPLRGLLLLAPVLAFAPLGYLRLWRDGQATVAAASLAIVTYYLLYNAAYVYWDGGWSYGPRLIGAALPFACLPLAAAWSAAGRVLRAVLGLFALWGVMLAATAVSTVPMPPNDVASPITTMLLPLLVGELSLDAFGAPPGSLGAPIGLRGPIAAVLPLAVTGLLLLVGLRERPRLGGTRTPQRRRVVEA